MIDQIMAARANLMKIAHQGLLEAQQQGADACKIVIGTHQSNRLVVESGEMSLASSLETRSIGVQVMKDQKKGSAVINTVSQDGLRQAIGDALALAHFSVPDPYLVLPDAREAPRAKELAFLYEEALATYSSEHMQELMLETLDIMQKDPRVALDRYELTLDVSWNGLVNSLGVVQDIKQAMMSWMFMGMAREGEQVSGMDYDSYFSYTSHGIHQKSRQDAELFAKKLVQSLNPRRCPSYKGVVVLSPRAVSDVFLDFILYHAGGRQLMDGKSKWSALETQVVSPLVSISDDPHSSRFSHASSYDGDGLPTRKQSLIEKGVLKTFFHDCYSAKKCGATSTATSGGPFGLTIAPGSDALAALLSQHSQVLLVDRFSGSTDPIDGSFSGVAKSSRLFQKGIDQGPVIETMISGDFFDLAHSVVALSQETEVVGGSLESPFFFIDGIHVTGA